MQAVKPGLIVTVQLPVTNITNHHLSYSILLWQSPDYRSCLLLWNHYFDFLRTTNISVAVWFYEGSGGLCPDTRRPMLPLGGAVQVRLSNGELTVEPDLIVTEMLAFP